MTARFNRPEEALQRTIIGWCRVALWPPEEGGPLVAHIPNGGGRSKAEAGILKAMGVRAGMPDLVVLWERRHAWAEIKVDKGEPTQAQRDCHRDITLCGGIVTIVRCLDDFREFIRMLNIPTREAGRTA